MQLDLDIGKILWSCLVYLFIAIFIGISQAAGIGGGPIINICLIIGLGYETKTSMAITYIFLLGGSTASIYSNYGKKIGKSHRNAIDTNLVIMTLPMTVSGAIFGALFNHFISELFITIAFTVLLTYLAYSSFKKFQDSRNVPKTDLSAPLVISTEMEQLTTAKTMNARLVEILKQQQIPFPPEKLKVFAKIIIVTVVVMLIKGGNSFQSLLGLQKCGVATQLCVLIHFAISYYFARSIADAQYKIDEEKISLGYVFEREEDKMSEGYMKKALLFGFCGGFAGGMLGIGGAIILVPAWLEMGINKSIVSASSAPLILSSAFISAIIAFLCEYYDSFLMVLFYFALSFIASYFIKSFITMIKVKYQLQGMIFLLLVLVMVMSLVFLLPYSFFRMFAHPEDFFAFGHFC